MRPAIPSVLAAVSWLALIAGADPTSAQTYPWCVFYDSTTYNCGFKTYEQCMQTARGNQGFCRPNPFAAPREQRQRRSRRN